MEPLYHHFRTGDDGLTQGVARLGARCYPYIRIYGLMLTHVPAILDQLSALADPTRARLLLLVESHELTVGELCTVLQLPQSTVSRHLKALGDAGWVTSRAEGTSRLYAMPRAQHDTATRRLWLLVREQVGSAHGAAQDHHRLQQVLAERRSRSQEFFSSAAGQWDRMRDELFGPGFHLQALLGLLDETWVVGDLGVGTGAVTAALAPFVGRVIAVDNSAAMLQAARRRMPAAANVEFRRGDLEALPVEDATLDAATLMLVLPYIAQPERVLQEAARVLKPGGRLLVADLLPHDREAYRQQLGHVRLGVSEQQIADALGAAGFDAVLVHPLPPDPRAKGPALFVASARRLQPSAPPEVLPRRTLNVER
jgi:ArsR family transcriptional regulator